MTQHDQRANGKNIAKPTTLVRFCPGCSTKGAWPIIGTQKNRPVLRCGICNREWFTNVKRGEL